MANYTVFNQGTILNGEAQDVLERIRKSAGAENEEIARMSVDEYATALLEDAPYFLEARLLDAMQKQSFDSEYDRALTYLAQMPTSGVRIISLQAAQTA